MTQREPDGTKNLCKVGEKTETQTHRSTNTNKNRVLEEVTQTHRSTNTNKNRVLEEVRGGVINEER